MDKRLRSRVSVSLIGALLATAPLMIATTGVRAQGLEASTITLDLRDAKLQASVAALTQKVGIKNVVIMPGEYQPVTVKLDGVSVLRALRIIAESAGATLTEDDGIYYLRPQGSKPAPTPAPAVKPTPEPVKVDDPPVVVAPPKKKGPAQLYRIPLNYMLPRDAKRWIDGEDPTYVTMFQRIAEENLANSRKVQSPILSGGTNTDLLQNAALHGSGLSNNNGPGAQAGAGAGRDSGALDSAGQFGGGRGGFGGFGGFGGGRGGGGNPFGGGGGGLQGGGGGLQGGGGGLPGGGQNQQGQLRPEGIETIIANDADNSLIITATDPDAVDRLRQLIKLLDKAPQEVIVKAEFVTVDLNDTDSFGVDWRFQPANNLDVFVPPSGGGNPTLYMAYASGNAVANMRAALTRSTNNILQAPIITTANNMPGFISISDVTNTVITTQILTQFGAFSQPVPLVIPAVQTLSILPHINADNTISMQVTPILQTQTVTIGANGFPTTTQKSQQVSAFRRLRNGETMVVGGFITRQESFTDDRVPLLSSLPIVGRLFQQKSKVARGSEILVFVTAQIIDPDNPGASRVSL